MGNFVRTNYRLSTPILVNDIGKRLFVHTFQHVWTAAEVLGAEFVVATGLIGKTPLLLIGAHSGVGTDSYYSIWGAAIVLEIDYNIPTGMITVDDVTAVPVAAEGDITSITMIYQL